MAKRNQDVMEMVEKTLKKNPDVSTKQLYKKAKDISKKIGDLTIRQFNARYPLQVKRKISGTKQKKRKKRASRKSTQVDREAIRAAMLKFATDIAEAEAADAIDVIVNVDEYVEEGLGGA